MNKKKGKEIRILLMGDDPMDRALIEEILAGEAAKDSLLALEHAGTFESGVARLEKGGIDLLLLDLDLPDKKGIRSFLEINRRVPMIPAVILSVLHDDSLALEAVRRGAQDYLFKNEIRSDLLLRTIRFAMERHRLRRELGEANARLEKLALMDPVTELFNRRGLQEILGHEVQRAQRKHSDLLAILVDLDDFRRINNALSHSAGDVILKEVAVKLKACLRSTDYVARVGGDEFLALLPDTRFGEGIQVAEKTRMAISTMSVSLTREESVKITASLGLVDLGLMIGPEGKLPSIDDLISKIHSVLYKSKQIQKNRLSYGHGEDSVPGLPGSLPGEDAWFKDLLNGGDQFHVMMQPIFRLSDLRETGYEFLSRSAVKGFEMPEDFFRASLEANILTQVDHQCLKVCVAAASLLPPGVSCHVNLFPSTLLGLPLGEFLNLFGTRNGKNPDYCIEISEQQIIGDPSYLAEAVANLKRAGIQIALDDLGFGRSCLESLILLEPDIVKIDKRCVTGAGTESGTRRSLKRLVRVARSLGSEIVAEGIESRSDLEVLKDMGIKYGQGYFLARPKDVPVFPLGEALASES